MTLVVLTAVVVSGVAAGPTSAAVPEPEPVPSTASPLLPLPGDELPGITPAIEGSAVEVAGQWNGDTGGGSGDATTVKADPPVIATIPDCAGNSIHTGVDVPCPEASAACPPGEMRLQFFIAPAGATIGDGRWRHLYTRCSAPVDPAGPPVVLTVEEFRRLPLPGDGSHVEPTGDALVTMPTNVFTTETDPVLLETTVVGVAVQVRATPTRWSWDFGDGKCSVGPTPQPGAPYPNLLNTCAYTERGTYDITMTTYYRGEYSVDDGATWLPVVGEAQVEGAPHSIRVLAGHNVLVDDLIGEND